MRLKGFTLIEIIVVILIIAILAAILIPTLAGYVSSSKLATANSNAKLAFESAATYCTSCQAEDKPVPGGTYNEICLKARQIPDTYVTDGRHLEDALLSMIGSRSSASGYTSIRIDPKGLPNDARWAKKPADRYVGSYPRSASEAGSYDLSY